MSYNHASHRQPGPYNHIQGPPTSQPPYHGYHTGLSSQAQDQQRPNSFIQGDDQPYPGSPVGQGQENYGAGTYGSGDGGQNYAGTYASSNPPPPPRSNQSLHGRSGYRHQERTEAAPYGQQAYNPQQYGLSSTQNWQAPAQPPWPSQNHAPVHTPYNPAVYQSPNSQYQPSYGGQQVGGTQNYASPTMSQYSTSSQQFSQHSYGRDYSNQVTPPLQEVSTFAPLSQGNQYFPPHNTQAHLQSDASYTPPAPPPPPFSPSRDAFSSRQSSTASNRHSQQSGIAPTPHHHHSQERFSPQTSQQPSLPPRYSSNGDTAVSSPRSYRQSAFSTAPHLNHSLPPTPGTPGPTPPTHSPQRSNTSGRHPQFRPLPGTPAQTVADDDYFGTAEQYREIPGTQAGQGGYDDLMRRLKLL